MSANKKLLIISGYVSSLFCDSLSAIIVSSTAVDAYNPFVIVFWCLFSKLLISFFIYLLQNYNKNNQTIGQVLNQLWQTCSLNSKTFFLYSVPSGLYLIADILWFYNLSHISPMTYRWLLSDHNCWPLIGCYSLLAVFSGSSGSFAPQSYTRNFSNAFWVQSNGFRWFCWPLDVW